MAKAIRDVEKAIFFVLCCTTALANIYNIVRNKQLKAIHINNINYKP